MADVQYAKTVLYIVCVRLVYRNKWSNIFSIQNGIFQDSDSSVVHFCLMSWDLILCFPRTRILVNFVIYPIIDSLCTFKFYGLKPKRRRPLWPVEDPRIEQSLSEVHDSSLFSSLLEWLSSCDRWYGERDMIERNEETLRRVSYRLTGQVKHNYTYIFFGDSLRVLGLC